LNLRDKAKEQEQSVHRIEAETQNRRQSPFMLE
jgi:hypothetical protein